MSEEGKRKEVGYGESKGTSGGHLLVRELLERNGVRVTIRECGYPTGKVRVFMSGGRRMAETSVSRPGYFGELKWVPAEMYTISVEEILAAAEKGGGS